MKVKLDKAELGRAVTAYLQQEHGASKVGKFKIEFVTQGGEIWCEVEMPEEKATDIIFGKHRL